MKTIVKKTHDTPALNVAADVREDARQRDPELGAMEQGEFCGRYHIDRVTFWKMRKAGTAPDVLMVGRKVLITYAAAREWERRMIERSREAKADAQPA